MGTAFVKELNMNVEFAGDQPNPAELEQIRALVAERQTPTAVEQVPPLPGLRGTPEAEAAAESRDIAADALGERMFIPERLSEKAKALGFVTAEEAGLQGVTEARVLGDLGDYDFAVTKFLNQSNPGLDLEIVRPKELTTFGGVASSVAVVSKKTGQKIIIDLSDEIDLGDIAEIGPSAAVVVGEILGFVGGSTGGPGFAILGGAAMGALSEASRLAIGRALEANNLSDEQIARQSGVVAAASAVGGTVAPLIMKAFSAVLSTVRGKGLAADFAKSVDETGVALEKTFAEAEAISQEVKAITGQALPSSVGQRVALEGRTLRSQALADVEERLAGAGRGPKLDEVRQTQKNVLNELEDKIEQSVPSLKGLGDAEAGQNIIQRLQAPVRAQETAISAATRQSDDAAQQAIANITAPTRQMAAQDIRNTLEIGIEALNKRLSDGYEAFALSIPERKVTLARVRTNALKLRKETRSLLPSLSQESGDLLTQLSRAGTREVDVAGDVAAKATIDEPVDFVVLQRTISDIKTARRAARKNPERAKAAKALGDIEQELVRARNAALTPEELATLQGLDNAYRGYKQTVMQGAIGKIIKVDSAGRFAMRDETIVPTLLRNSEDAKNIKTILDDPDVGEFGPDVNRLIRDGMRREYLDTVVKNGVVNEARHNAFMQNNRQSLEMFLEPKEITKLNKARTAARMFKDQELREARQLKDLSKVLGTVVADVHPGALARAVWTTPLKGELAVEAIPKIKRILGPNSKEWRDFQALSWKAVKDKMTAPNTATNRREFNLANMFKTFEDPRLMKGIEETFGKDFVSKLSTFRRGLNLAQKRLGQDPALAADVASTPAVTTGQLIVRATLTPPLTPRGRAFSAALRAQRKAVQSAADEILSDPATFKEAIELGRIRENFDPVIRFLSLHGGGAIAKDFNERDPARQGER